MRWNSHRRPNSVSRALAWAMRVPSRLEASTTQADRGDPQLSTTLTGTTPRPVHAHRHAGWRDQRAGSFLAGSALGGSWHSDFGGAYLGQPLFGVVAAHDSKQPALGVVTTIARRSCRRIRSTNFSSLVSARTVEGPASIMSWTATSASPSKAALRS